MIQKVNVLFLTEINIFIIVCSGIIQHLSFTIKNGYMKMALVKVHIYKHTLDTLPSDLGFTKFVHGLWLALREIVTAQLQVRKACVTVASKGSRSKSKYNDNHSNRSDNIVNKKISHPFITAAARAKMEAKIIARKIPENPDC